MKSSSKLTKRQPRSLVRLGYNGSGASTIVEVSDQVRGMHDTLCMHIEPKRREDEVR